MDLGGTYRLVNRTDARDRLGARVRRSGDRGALDVVRPRRRRRARGRRRRLPDLRPRPPARARRLARGSRSTSPSARAASPTTGSRRTSSPTARSSTGGGCRSSAISRRSSCQATTRGDASDSGRARACPDPATPARRERRFDVRDPDRVHVDAIIGTSADQIAVTPGVLRGSWTENGRRYFHYETDATDLVRQRRVLREVRGARGPLERRRARDLPSPVAHVRPRPDGPRHEGVARVLHDAVRSLAGQPAAHRRVPALRRLRPRGPADDRVRRGRVPQPRPRGRGRSAVLRDRARGRAPVVGRHGSGRAGARRGVPVGIARQLQRDDGGREDVRHGGGTAGLRVPDESLPARARAAVARGAAAGGGGPAVHRLPQGRDRAVHAAPAHRRGSREPGAPAVSRGVSRWRAAGFGRAVRRRRREPAGIAGSGRRRRGPAGIRWIRTAAARPGRLRSMCMAMG